MKLISVRVDDSLRRKMRKLRHVNWSEVIRSAIRERMRLELSENVAEAVLLNEKLRRKPKKGWESWKEIRKWRDRR
jgi:Arc/MetJ-type ribon-helix-helix transcriptional regulator